MGNNHIRCAVVGYGPTFNFGWIHAKWIEAVPDLELVAICDRDPQRAAAAAADFPQVAAYQNLDELLARDDLDMVSVVTPHDTHAELACRCLRAGKHTIVEKPMCLSVAEATTMIETARQAGKTLAVFHNRRHDGNVRAIREIIQQGILGEVFHIELSACGYGRPDATWRSRQESSGGLLYDWGSHAVDWVLSLVSSPMAQITGFSHKLVWDSASNEDQAQAIILFENGVVADVMQSNIAHVGKPLWRILGTRGAILDTGAGAIEGYCREIIGPPGGSLKLVTAAGEQEVPYKESDWVTYYADMADHLLRGAPVPVSGEHGRRVIAVLETARRSAAERRSLPPPFP